jgi:Tfp pilus assembly protein PilN
VCWKAFSFLHSNTIEKIELAVKSILMQSAVTFSRPAVDGIILQAADAGQLSDKLNENLGIETVVAGNAGYTDSLRSYSLAMSARSQKSDVFNLFRELRPKPDIMQIFPWKLAAMIVFAACCMAFMMWQKASKFARSYNVLNQQDSLYAWADNKTTTDIMDELKTLVAETEAVDNFLSTRIVWSDYLRDLPTRLPTNVSLSNISVMCEFKGIDKKSTERELKRSLSLRGTTLFDKGRASPEEIDTFMESLRKVELLQRDFPLVQLAEIKWRSQGGLEMATFTVLAMPKKIKSKPKPTED